MRLTGEYPTPPPFVRVISPRFEFHTGHVTVGGSICMQELTTGDGQHGWSASMTMERVLDMVHVAMLEGGGAVDEARGGVPYSYEEAKAAFERVAMQHGWMP